MTAPGSPCDSLAVKKHILLCQKAGKGAACTDQADTSESDGQHRGTRVNLLEGERLAVGKGEGRV